MSHSPSHFPSLEAVSLKLESHPIMFSPKQLFSVLTVVFLCAHAAVGLSSQCSHWAAGNSDVQKPLVAKLMSTHQEAAQNRNLTRRNTPPGEKGSAVAGGPSSICSESGYISVDVPGAVLWNGLDQSSVVPQDFYPGWLNGNNHKNCGKKLWIIGNAGTDNPTYVTVVDGAQFKSGLSVADGCATIWVTLKTFKDLGGTDGSNEVTIQSWDFDQGNKAD